ncbi:MAG: nickel-dependent hydrogenase large subunit [Candidatus Riflebacteria bacterium]|nr:nickel-dependent hydrogenase large subunit [Candidatus Riflebacteria bacterium]
MIMNITLDPLTRIEGHLSIKVDVDNNKVVKAECAGEMFRGFELLLRGRHPMDAHMITQRICGVCPIDHGMASTSAQEAAFRVSPPTNGRLLRNLIQGANYVHSHIVHFYQLSALDFIDVTAIIGYTGKDDALLLLQDWVKSQLQSEKIFPAAPFLPRYEGTYAADAELNVMALKHYLDAMTMRRQAHEAAAMFSGKIPHSTSLMPGGVTELARANTLAAYRSIAERLRAFVVGVYMPDVIAVAKAFPQYFTYGRGPDTYLSYGGFPENDARTEFLLPSGVVRKGALEVFDASHIGEEVKHSLFNSKSGLHPSRGETLPEPGKSDAYSWLKAPRYDGQPMEVGPLARFMVALLKTPKSPTVVLGQDILSQLKLGPEVLNSVLGRHLVRALECKAVVERMLDWVDQTTPGELTFKEFELPQEGEGMGLTEAARGALGHWISVKKGVIDNYQCVVPTTWNASPRDDHDVAGPIEQALVGTPIADPKNPVEAARVVRSFDPCLACAIH